LSEHIEYSERGSGVHIPSESFLIPVVPSATTDFSGVSGLADYERFLELFDLYGFSWGQVGGISRFVVEYFPIAGDPYFFWLYGYSPAGYIHPGYPYHGYPCFLTLYYNLYDDNKSDELRLVLIDDSLVFISDTSGRGSLFGPEPEFDGLIRVEFSFVSYVEELYDGLTGSFSFDCLSDYLGVENEDLFSGYSCFSVDYTLSVLNFYTGNTIDFKGSFNSFVLDGVRFDDRSYSCLLQPEYGFFNRDISFVSVSVGGELFLDRFDFYVDLSFYLDYLNYSGLDYGIVDISFGELRIINLGV
jgi:hypothetical protein